MKLNIPSRIDIYNTPEEQNIARVEFGLDGVQTIKALKLYFEFCKEIGTQPYVNWCSTRSGTTCGTSILVSFYQARIVHGKKTETGDYSSLSTIDIHFTSELATLIEYYNDKILNVLLKAYKTTGLPASVIIPRFIEAAETGIMLEDLLGIAQSLVKTVTKTKTPL